MHAGDVVQELRDLYPARQDGDIGNKADIAHEAIAFGPGVAAEDFQISLIRGEAENGVERGGFASTVGTDEYEDAAFFHAQVDGVQRDGCSESFTEAACFNDGHGFGSFCASFIESSDDGRVAVASNSSWGVRRRR